MSRAEFDVADVFRNEWPRLVARLVRDFGDVGLAEDAAQEAFVEAARRWSPDNTPDVPEAWLLTTARRKAIDDVRRSRRSADRLARMATENLRAAPDHVTVPVDQDPPDSELVDDQLALLLGCCHPALAFNAQVALTLRIVAGLTSAQIARAFLVNESTMTRRLTRAKSKIRAANIPFDRSNLQTLHERLPAVCAIVYSIFTEGHASASSAALVRGDLCDEAIWLGSLVRELVPEDAEVAGLLALMQLTDARRQARTDADGMPILLADQDRSLWDAEKIARGLANISAAHSMRSIGHYQLQAAIAAVHATAPSFVETDWYAIVGVYEVQLSRQPSALLGLNWAIALFQRDGAAAGLKALSEIEERMPFSGELNDYPYYHSARGEMLAEIGNQAAAAEAFRKALTVSSNEAERRHLASRIAACSTYLASMQHAPDTPA
ncbi:MAG: RNA polymerase sigma factor [Acidimicrobiia bacterium]